MRGPGARAGARICLAVGLAAMFLPAEAADRKCLTPAAGQALSDLVASGKIQAALTSEFSFVGGDVRGRRIDVEIQDREKRSYAVTLALPPAEERGEPRARGRQFLFYLPPSASPPSPRATDALLAIAGLFDQAVPETALAPCPELDPSTTHRAAGERPPGEPRVPRAVALVSAVVQVLALLAACLNAVRIVAAEPPLDL